MLKIYIKYWINRLLHYKEIVAYESLRHFPIVQAGEKVINITDAIYLNEKYKCIIVGARLKKQYSVK